MAISDEDIQKVREASDLVAIMGETGPVKQRGRDFWLCCPFHNEKTPSCKIDPALQLWHCFGCGEGGDAFAFLMKSDGLTFPEAVRARYAPQGAGQTVVDEKQVRELGVELVYAPVADFSDGLARHDSDALAAALVNLFQEKSPTRIYNQ